MDDKLFGETIRIEAASFEGLVALAVAAIGAFARAAGGDPSEGGALEEAVRAALDGGTEGTPAALCLTLVQGAVELRSVDRTDSEPFLVWSA